MNIYLDYAATTPLDRRVFEKMIPHMTDLFANPSSSHFFGREAQCALDNARDGLADLLGAKPAEVYFTAGGSEADNWAIKGFAHTISEFDKQNKQILISAIEHHAVINTAHALLREGYKVNFIPVNSLGLVDLDALSSLLKTPTALVCVMMANNEVGTLQPISTIGKMVHEAGAYLFSDCVQAALYCDLNVKNLPVDMLSVSAHKFYGPKGMGALYIKKGVPMSALIDGGEQERGLRGGTSNTPGAVGLFEAFRLCVAEREENATHVQALRDRFISEVERTIDGVMLNGDRMARVPCNANFSFMGIDGTALLRRLDLSRIAASAGSACASGAIEPSHVLTAMHVEDWRAKSAIRFTFGKGNTMPEVERVVSVLQEVVSDLRK